MRMVTSASLRATPSRANDLALNLVHMARCTVFLVRTSWFDWTEKGKRIVGRRVLGLNQVMDKQAPVGREPTGRTR
jgi:hypothetical protein